MAKARQKENIMGRGTRQGMRSSACDEGCRTVKAPLERVPGGGGGRPTSEPSDPKRRRGKVG